MSFRTISQSQFRYYLSITWLIFTCALTFWWWLHGLLQLEAMESLLSPADYERNHRMLMSEGAFFLATIFVGGVSLVILAKKDFQRHEQIRLFFANFTHDLKTSMARLRIQSDLLRDQWSEQGLNKWSDHLNQLDLQLENSLWVARGDKQNFHYQSKRISSLLSSIRVEWPEIEISLEHDAELWCDELAMKSVFRNLLQNAVFHGQAKKIDIKVQKSNDRVELSITDDGVGFKGDVAKLGKNFIQPKSAHGNGLGLYLTRFLLEKMNGTIEFKQDFKQESKQQDHTAKLSLLVKMSLPAGGGKS